jgi:hypothetical protein
VLFAEYIALLAQISIRLPWDYAPNSAILPQITNLRKFRILSQPHSHDLCIVK